MQKGKDALQVMQNFAAAGLYLLNYWMKQSERFKEKL